MTFRKRCPLFIAVLAAAVSYLHGNSSTGQETSGLPPVSPMPTVSPMPPPATPAAVQFQRMPPSQSGTSPWSFQQFNPQQQAMPPQLQQKEETDPFKRGKILIKSATQLIAEGRLDDAVPLLQKAVELRRADPTPQFFLGLINDQKGASQAALTNYSQSVKKATALGMDSAQLRINLGNTLVKLNYLKEAEFDYKRAIDIDDKNEVAHLNLGRLLLFKGDNQGAFNELTRAHELMATDPNLPLYEALALKGLGNTEGSKQQLQIFLERAKGLNSDPRVINMAEKLLATMN